MKVLITGICGFVGSELAQALRETLGSQVTILGIDNFGRPGSETNRLTLKRRGIAVTHADLRNASDLAGLPDVDWVIDAAANPSVLAGVDGKSSPRQLLEHNLWGTVESLEYCRRTGAGFILLSTSRVYSIPVMSGLPVVVRGDSFELDASTPAALPAGVSAEGIDPEFSTSAPISLYGATKLASEALALEYLSAFGTPVWINRCGVLAGAGQFGTADQGIFSYWINAHLRKRKLRYIGFEGKGFQCRDAFHPADLASLLLLQMQIGRKDGRRLYTVGGGPGRCMSLAQLTSWCDQKFGAWAVEPDLKPRPYDIPWFIMDSTLAKADFGWQPQMSLEAILSGIADHAQQHPEWLDLSSAVNLTGNLK